MRVLSTTSVISNLDILPQDAAYVLRGSEYLCFLDSSLTPDKYSKFSYIAWDPKFTIKSFGYRNEFNVISKGIKYYSYQHPLFFLKQNIGNYAGSSLEDDKNIIRTLFVDGNKIRETADVKTSSSSGKNNNLKAEGSAGFKLPDFKGGFIGYFSYDLKNYIEKLPQSVLYDINLPLFYFVYYDKLISYSHDENKWYFIRNFQIKSKDRKCGSSTDIIFLPGDYIDYDFEDKSLTKRVDLEKREVAGRLSCCKQDINNDNKNSGFSEIKKSIINKYYKKNIPGIDIKSDFTRKNYLEGITKAKKYIHDGDIYQVNFSQRFECNLQVEPADLYYILREKNAAPFSVFIKFPELSIGSSSPERFLFLKDDIIETRPIKGTRPRGKDRNEDKKYAKELKNSIKDRAELNMIVDLERNDLGKFCYYGSVKVFEHAVIEKYARVFHSVSTVTGRVKKGYDVADIIKAAFPGGSITGAPKIRAMEIIDELEPVARGIYTGSIGYIGIGSVMDLNIVIRTFVVKGSMFYYNVGGGIIEDSNSEDEYDETLDKGIALKETLKFFEAKNLKKLL